MPMTTNTHRMGVITVYTGIKSSTSSRFHNIAKICCFARYIRYAHIKSMSMSAIR